MDVSKRLGSMLGLRTGEVHMFEAFETFNRYHSPITLGYNHYCQYE